MVQKKKFNKEDVVKNKNEAVSKINEYLDECILQDDKHMKKANLFSFWLKEHIAYLKQEETFNPYLLKEYSRGDVIKVNLGFNVGNEEGGLHYCIVLDKHNAKMHSTITIIPLTSVKPNSKPRNTSVFLGNDIYQNLLYKNKILLEEAESKLKIFKEELEKSQMLPENNEEEKIIKEYKVSLLVNQIDEGYSKLELIEKINKELEQMKSGSIALINQITTVSKQRIYNPKKDIDILSGIKLSDEKMKLIDEKIKKFFIN